MPINNEAFWAKMEEQHDVEVMQSARDALWMAYGGSGNAISRFLYRYGVKEKPLKRWHEFHATGASEKSLTICATTKTATEDVPVVFWAGKQAGSYPDLPSVQGLIDWEWAQPKTEEVYNAGTN